MAMVGYLGRMKGHLHAHLEASTLEASALTR